MLRTLAIGIAVAVIVFAATGPEPRETPVALTSRAGSGQRRLGGLGPPRAPGEATTPAASWSVAAGVSDSHRPSQRYITGRPSGLLKTEGLRRTVTKCAGPVDAATTGPARLRVELSRSAGRAVVDDRRHVAGAGVLGLDFDREVGPVRAPAACVVVDHGAHSMQTMVSVGLIGNVPQPPAPGPQLAEPFSTARASNFDEMRDCGCRGNPPDECSSRIVVRPIPGGMRFSAKPSGRLATGSSSWSSDSSTRSRKRLRTWSGSEWPRWAPRLP
jgi:hypothetical protein